MERPAQVRRYLQMRFSFCIGSMDRLYHLRETLPVSIRNTERFGSQVEFVLLNYGSRDGLNDWMRAEGVRFIEAGLLSYFDMVEPVVKHMNLPHCKNVAHRLARGDVVCNLDADHFLTRPYLEELISIYETGGGVFVHTDLEWSTAGRLAFWRDDFLGLGGYDEELSYCEDLDAIGRAKEFGLTPVEVERELVEYIPHGDRERVARFSGAAKQSPTDMLASLVKSNKKKSAANLRQGRLIANVEAQWGKAVVKKNFFSIHTVGGSISA